MTNKPSPKTVSLDNHTLLIQVSDSLSNLSTQLTTHIAEQQVENQRLHSRIDDTQQSSQKGVEQIKDSLAARGRVSSTQIFSLIAVLLSTLTLIGGVTGAYVSIRIDNLVPTIEENRSDIDSLKDWIDDDIRADLEELRLYKRGRADVPSPK